LYLYTGTVTITDENRLQDRKAKRGKSDKEKNMRHILALVLTVFFCVSSTTWADEVDQLLPEPVSSQIRSNTRAMIRSGVDSEEAIKLTRTMIQNRFQEHRILEVQEVVIETHLQGLPSMAVMNKAYEGIAKHVDAERIIAAMRQVQSRFAASYQYARGVARDQAAVQKVGGIVVDAMTAGLTTRSMDQIMTQFENRVQTMTPNRADVSDLFVQTILTTRDMLRLSVPPDLAVDMMIKALRHGYNAMDLKTLRQSFSHQARYSSIVQLAKSYAAAIDRGETAQSISGSVSSGPGATGIGSAAGSSSSGPGPGSGGGSDGGTGPGGGGAGSGGGAGPGGGGAGSGGGAGPGGAGR
jgi:hypothetical protein